MPQDYGAAQPIADVVKGGVQKIEHFFGGGAPAQQPAAQPDTSWHDSMVRAANQSMQKQSAGAGMAKFEEHSHHHEVHEIHKPQGHGYVDQKYGKGNMSPISGSVPTVGAGTVPGADGAGSPGEAGAEYGGGSSGVQ